MLLWRIIENYPLIITKYPLNICSSVRPAVFATAVCFLCLYVWSIFSNGNRYIVLLTGLYNSHGLVVSRPVHQGCKLELWDTNSKKNPKHLDTWKVCGKHTKIQTRWLYHRIMWCSLIWVYTVCPDMSVRKPIRIIMVRLWSDAPYMTQLSRSQTKNFVILTDHNYDIIVGRVKRIWYLSPMRAAKVQASLRICAVSPEPPLLAHTSRESRGTFRQKPRSLAPLNGWACAVKIWHDGMLEDKFAWRGPL